jgi:hypothetical protein
MVSRLSAAWTFTESRRTSNSESTAGDVANFGYRHAYAGDDLDHERDQGRHSLVALSEGQHYTGIVIGAPFSATMIARMRAAVSPALPED